MVSLPNRRGYLYYGGLQNYGGFNHFHPEETSYHNSVREYRYYKIFRRKGLHANLQN